MGLKELSSLVRYDPDTGLFFAPDGSQLGSRHSRGYVQVCFAGEKELAHRLAWVKMTGEIPAAVDHRNRDKTDNRWSNLRLATASQNQCNRGAQSNNTSGVPGVALDRHGRKWQAYIKLRGKRKHLGVFESFEEAVAARKAAEPVVFGPFAP